MNNINTTERIQSCESYHQPFTRTDLPTRKRSTHRTISCNESISNLRAKTLETIRYIQNCDDLRANSFINQLQELIRELKEEAQDNNWDEERQSERMELITLLTISFNKKITELKANQRSFDYE